jgi:hypothetical protein
MMGRKNKRADVPFYYKDGVFDPLWMLELDDENGVDDDE